ncbi:hypothetical protein EV715DRAFT_264402 [Schizophyllum commune]
MDPNAIQSYLDALPPDAQRAFQHIVDLLSAAMSAAQDAAAAAEQRAIAAEQQALAAERQAMHAEQRASDLELTHQHFIQVQAALDQLLQQAPPAPAPAAPRSNILRVTPRYFEGDTNKESAVNWLSHCEDVLQSQNVDVSNWVSSIAAYMKLSAQVWWIGYKSTHPVLPAWTAFKADLIARFQPPVMLDELRLKMQKLTYHGAASYIENFQRLESQVPSDRMLFDDRFFAFRNGIPSSLSMYLNDPRVKPTSMADVYNLTLEWDQVSRVSSHQSSASAGHRQQPSNKPFKKRQDTPYPRAFPSFGTSSSSANPAPMDLDVLDSPSTSSASRAANARCYNCNKLGHFSRDCKAPRRPNNAPRPQGGRPQSGGRPRQHGVFVMAEMDPPEVEDVAQVVDEVELSDDENLPGVHNGAAPPVDDGSDDEYMEYTDYVESVSRFCDVPYVLESNMLQDYFSGPPEPWS